MSDEVNLQEATSKFIYTLATAEHAVYMFCMESGLYEEAQRSQRRYRHLFRRRKLEDAGRFSKRVK